VASAAASSIGCSKDPRLWPKHVRRRARRQRCPRDQSRRINREQAAQAAGSTKSQALLQILVAASVDLLELPRQYL